MIRVAATTYIDQLACPMLVIQGRNDPRVVEPESHDLVTYLRQSGKQVEYLVFENEGHDVLKYENRVRCYNEITEFFRKNLNP
jgi:dipeptidyl aminopeptidase/acylaminoacyl peptidase